MGIYNIIKTKQKCPKCNASIDEWQSKYLTYNGYVLENLLEEIKLSSHMNGEMHALCNNCKAFSEVSIIKGVVSFSKKKY